MTNIERINKICKRYEEQANPNFSCAGRDIREEVQAMCLDKETRASNRNGKSDGIDWKGFGAQGYNELSKKDFSTMIATRMYVRFQGAEPNYKKAFWLILREFRWGKKKSRGQK